MRYKIIIEYDGTYFSGWQWQKDRVTVQSALSKAIFDLTKEQVTVEGSGRTDAGVHAVGQVGHFDLKRAWMPFKLQSGLNHYLKDSGVMILSADYTTDDFHARFNAALRTYKYIILNRFADPIIDKNRVWHVKSRLNFDLMQQAAISFVGCHDFTSFRASACQAKSPIKTIAEFSLIKDDKKIIATIKAKSFLHNQIRIMIGTLKQIAEGTLDKNIIEKLLKEPSRSEAGITAPPYGLYFVSTEY